MRIEHFDVPVTIESTDVGRRRVVTDTLQAAEMLLRRWPEDSQDATHHAALRACLDVMEGRRQVASARRAFVVAAKQAHMLVRTANLPR